MQPESPGTIDPLDQLRPILLPSHEVSSWPLAPGWWILIAIVSVLIILGWWLKPKILAQRALNKRWKHSQFLLENLYQDCHKQSDLPVALQYYLQQSNEIFKRSIRHLADNSSLPVLNGDTWVHFLGAIPLPITGRYEYLYGNQLYAKSCGENIQLEDLHHWACAWLIAFKKHHKKYTSPAGTPTDV